MGQEVNPSDSYHKKTVTIKVDENLLLRAKSELDLSIDEFVEYALTMYLKHEDTYAKLFYQGAKHYSELKKIQEKMQSMEDTKPEGSNSYDQAMSTVDRIYSTLGHIGKDKLRKIAADNNISGTDLINHTISLGYEVTNFTATIK